MHVNSCAPALVCPSKSGSSIFVCDSGSKSRESTGSYIYVYSFIHLFLCVHIYIYLYTYTYIYIYASYEQRHTFMRLPL